MDAEEQDPRASSLAVYIRMLLYFMIVFTASTAFADASFLGLWGEAAASGVIALATASFAYADLKLRLFPFS